jgi:AraC-like DNA-binding protein
MSTIFEIQDLHIKGMVCRRCIKVITDELEKSGVEVLSIELGKAKVKYPKGLITNSMIKSILQNNDFELLNDEETQIIERIKIIIIQLVDNLPIVLNQKLSEFVSSQIGKDYTYLSKLFSKVEGKTIEKYFIKIKIEKVKELLVYDELSLSQISYELNYSSPQHLSKQFKKITGLTPTEFKIYGKRKKIDLI